MLPRELQISPSQALVLHLYPLLPYPVVPARWYVTFVSSTSVRDSLMFWFRQDRQATSAVARLGLGLRVDSWSFHVSLVVLCESSKQVRCWLALEHVIDGEPSPLFHHAFFPESENAES